MTQNEMILDHLQEHNSISSAEAYELYGCLRLSARIYDLRATGIPIIAHSRTARNRYGNAVTFSEYSILGK